MEGKKTNTILDMSKLRSNGVYMCILYKHMYVVYEIGEKIIIKGELKYATQECMAQNKGHIYYIYSRSLKKVTFIFVPFCPVQTVPDPSC